MEVHMLRDHGSGRPEAQVYAPLISIGPAAEAFEEPELSVRVGPIIALTGADGKSNLKDSLRLLIYSHVRAIVFLEVRH